MIAAVIVGAAALAAGAAVFFVSYRRHEERARYYSAAKALVQSEILDYEIRNHATGKLIAPPSTRRIILYLRVHARPPQKYVLDPQKGILFGRDSAACDVLLNEAVVSQRHCRIQEQNGAVWLTDLGSANGTVLRKGLFHKVTLHSGQSVRVSSGDKLYLGRTRFDLTLFLFDNTRM